MISRTILIFLIPVLLSSCAKIAKKEESASIEDRSTDMISTEQEKPRDDEIKSDTQSYGAGAEEETLLHPLYELKNQSSVPPSEQLIYFPYNSARVRPEHRATIEAHAQYLTVNPDLHIILTGHADERGSREYNLALGEYRAQAVKRYMILLGVASDRVRIISYGEERPVVDGHDEFAWSQNRRVEINY